MTSKTVLRVILAIANCFYGFGGYFIISAPWVVQDMIEGPLCDANSSMGNITCCDTCLGFSSVEYNMYIAIAFWTSLPIVFLAGFILDHFGAPRTAIVCASLGIAGCFIRTISSVLGHYHGVCYVLMAAGEILVAWSFNMSVVVRNYIAGRYFPRVRAISTSCCYSASLSAFIVVFYTMSSFGHRFGLPTTQCVIMIVSIAPLCSGIVIWACDKKLTRPGPPQERTTDDEEEEEHMNEAVRRRVEKPRLRALGRQFCLHMRGACGFQLLLLSAAAVATHGELSPFTANSILFLWENYGIKPETASMYIGALYIIMVVVSPVVGLVVARLSCFEISIILGGILSTSAYLVLNFAHHLHPLGAIIVCGFGEAFTNYNVPALTSTLIPTEHLGVGMAIICFCLNLSIGVFSALTGFYVQYLPSRLVGWMAALSTYACVNSLAVIAGALLLLLKIIGRRGANTMEMLQLSDDFEDSTRHESEM